MRDLAEDISKCDSRDNRELSDLNDKNSEIEPVEPSSDKNKNGNREQTKEIQVYSRRNRTQEKKTEDSQHYQKSVPQDLTGIQGNLPIDSISKYPISMFMSYKKLSPSYSAFTSQLSSVEIPKNVQDALRVPEWKEAILGELRALEKKRDMGVSGFTGGKETSGL